MGRRLFEERKYDVTGKVLPLADYRPFLDAPDGFTIQPGQCDNLIKVAEKALAREIPQLLASEFMLFRRTGNRIIHERKETARKVDLFQLALGEYVEKKGRFTDRIVDLIWLILEETTWVTPACNPDKVRGIGDPLPYAYKDDPDFIDLSTGCAGATLAWVYYLLKDELDKVTPIISERIEYELERRVIRPFMNPAAESRCWWMGVAGNVVNNWNPWIISNVLTVCALVEKDTVVREKLVARAMLLLDNFTKWYHDDGGCDEGPGYWTAAGAALFDSLQILYDMTGGYVNMYDDPLVKKMGEYVIKVCINGNRFVNFADCPAKFSPDPLLLLRWGKLCNSEMMTTYAQNRLNGTLPLSRATWYHPYRELRNSVEPICKISEFIAPTKFWFNGIVVAGARESTATDKGLFFAMKGGHNAESHNHNDIGNFMVFADGQPIFIDAGSGQYTKKTFSSERYTIWAMRSEYHNCATVNGVDQQEGINFRSTDNVYDENTGALSIQLKEAYPAEAGIVSYVRSAELSNGAVRITDEFEFAENGTVTFNYLCNVMPENVTEASFDIHGRTVRFDDRLEYSVEKVDCSEPEVLAIPINWECEGIYRVTLTAKNKFTKTKFDLTVS